MTYKDIKRLMIATSNWAIGNAQNGKIISAVEPDEKFLDWKVSSLEPAIDRTGAILHIWLDPRYNDNTEDLIYASDY